MAEQSVIMLRNEPCIKLELIYNDNGWLDKGGKAQDAAYILRLWILRDGSSTVREIRMRPEEFGKLRIVDFPLYSPPMPLEIPPEV